MDETDEEDKKKPPVSIGEYLQSMRDTGKVFRWILGKVLTSESKKYTRQGIIATFVVMFLQGILAFLIGWMFDSLVSRNGSVVAYCLGAIAACLITQKIAEAAMSRSRERAIHINWWRMDDLITKLFLEKSLGQHAHEGNTLSVGNIDKGRWKSLDLQGLIIFDAVPTIAQLVVSLGLLLVLDLVSGFMMLCVTSGYVVWSIYFNYKVSNICTPIDKDFRALNRRRIERFERVERVKVSGKEETEVSEMSVQFNDVAQRNLSFWVWFINQATWRSLFNVIGVVTVLSYGVWKVWIGDWTVGLLFPLFAWTSRVSENLWRIGSIEHQINSNLPTVRSMIDALSMPPAIVDSAEAVTIDPKTTHRIELREVSHTYPADSEKEEGSPAALSRISFAIEPGEKIALLGPSGAGKSTIMKKILRFSDPTSGSVLIDGINLCDISQASWRAGIGYIPQQSQVFDGTIRYNLTYGLSDRERSLVSDDELWSMMKLLKIDFGSRLTNGLDTVVGKNGVKLSGGQAQRLMIGSAVMKKPWLLVIDEATSSLDSTTERQVQAGLEEVLAGTDTSALIVAHRLSTVRRVCDRYVILKPIGEVTAGESQVEAIGGSFEELYESSPTFRRLADDQELSIRA